MVMRIVAHLVGFIAGGASGVVAALLLGFVISLPIMAVFERSKIEKKNVLVGLTTFNSCAATVLGVFVGYLIVRAFNQKPSAGLLVAYAGTFWASRKMQMQAPGAEIGFMVGGGIGLIIGLMLFLFVI